MVVTDSNSLCRQAMAFWDTPEFLDACFLPHPSFQMGRRGSDEHRFLCAMLAVAP